MDWAKIARDAYLAIGREYGPTRRKPLPVADFARFGPRALDVGAGTGAQPAYLEHEHPYVVHCDLDRRLMPHGDSVECEATMLPFRNGAFDVAYLIAVIHHMPPHAAAKALAEAKRTARRAVATVWQPSRGREAAPGIYEVPWGARAIRIYHQYGIHELLKIAPAKPLSIGTLRRGKELNHYIIL